MRKQQELKIEIGRRSKKKLILTLRTWCGILMSMIMIVMPIWIGIGWIVVTLQYISIRCWCRQRMISLEIKLEFVMMGFDLLLMLIINLTVFLIISGFFEQKNAFFKVVVVVQRCEEMEEKRNGKECWILML